MRKHIKTIQTNAIRSWTLLKPTPEVILLGNEEGIPEVANDLKVRYITSIRYNRRGIPMLNSIFENARAHASNELICYINSDIILMQDFIHAVDIVRKIKENFLIVSQRWDLNISREINFNSPDDFEKFRLQGVIRGKLHPPTGVDFHVSPSKTFHKMGMLPFVLGRGFSDHWLIWRARSLNIPVIDITPVIKIFHQNHDYLHISVGAKSWEGPHGTNPDFLWNKKLAGRWLFRYNINQASHLLTPKGLEYRYIHPLLEPIFVNAKLFLELGIGELLDNVPPIKRAIKHMIRRIRVK